MKQSIDRLIYLSAPFSLSPSFDHSSTGSARSNLTDQYNVICPDNQGLLPSNPDLLVEFSTMNELPLTVAAEFCQYVHQEEDDASDLIFYSYFGNFETGTVLEADSQLQQQSQLQLETNTTTCAIGAGTGCNVVTQTFSGKADRLTTIKERKKEKKMHSALKGQRETGRKKSCPRCRPIAIILASRG